MSAHVITVGVNIGVKPSTSIDPDVEAAEYKLSLVGPVGIEPTTCGLKVRCSTAELKALQTRLIRLRHDWQNRECKNCLLFFRLQSS